MADQYELLARYYDALAQARNIDEVRGDKKFYVEEAVACGGPVVEFGAGTLRIGLGIAEAGIGVVAVDNSPAMLEIGRAKIRRNYQG